MKKTKLTILGLGLCLSFFAIPLKAQDEKPTKVTITITENDMVSTDTTFELKGSQDPEMITEIVAKLTGEDIHGKHEKTKTIDLMVHAHEDMDKAGEDHDAEVIVIRKGDKDIKVIKKVRVKVEDDDDPSDEAEKDDIMK